MSTPAVIQPETVPQLVPEALGPGPAPYTTPAPQTSVAAAPSASLYVGELDPSVTEAMLFEIFNMIGPVARLAPCGMLIRMRLMIVQYSCLP